MTAALDYLRSSPLFWVFVTVAGYRAGVWLRDRTGGHPLAQPVLVGIIIVISVVSVLGVDYDTYFEGGAMIHFLLGPVTVALAVPLYRQAHRLRVMLLPLLVAIPIGAAASIISAVATVHLLGGDDVLARTLAPKSATAPVAIAVADQVGGMTSLVAVFSVIAGISGAVVGPALLTLMRVHDPMARGLAMGAVSHGIGTSRSLHDDPVEGAFAGLSMGLTALATSLIVPVVVAALL